MRTGSAKVTAEVGKNIVVAFYLCELRLGTETLRLSSGGPVTWDNHLWAGDLYVLNPPSDAGRGTRVATIGLSNMDEAAAAIILAQPTRDQVCKLWSLRGMPPYDLADPIIEIDGHVSGVPEIGDDRAILTIRGGRSRYRIIPRRSYQAPTYNHMPEPGATYTIDGVPTVIDAR